MIAEEYNIDFKPNLSIPKGTIINCILNCIKQTVIYYKSAIQQPNLSLPLNENKLTQIFIEQIDIQLRKASLPIGVKNQYSDLFWGTKGIPDFYFHHMDEGVVCEPLFLCESKRLPAPVGSIKTEYVIGDKTNGGIERFKIGKHGKGLSECGMIGFVESESFKHWSKQINSWISNLASTNLEWNVDEILRSLDENSVSAYLNSLVHRTKENDLLLHHIWIN